MRDDWKISKLSEICQIKPPKKEARQKLSDSDLVSFVPMRNLGERTKHLILDENRPLNKVVGSYTYFAENDVLLAKITPCFENGKLGIARDLTNGIGFGSSEYIVFRSNGDIDPEYLFYFLSQDSFRDAGAKVMAGAVGHKRVPKEFIENHQIPLPPLPEQKHIVTILDKAFAAINQAAANAEKNLANSRELFESYLNIVFSEKGEGWVEKGLSEVMKITHGHAFKGKDFTVSTDDALPIVLTPGNYTEDATLRFTKKNTKRLLIDPPSGYEFNVGDLTVVMTDLSSKMKILGKPAIIEKRGVLHNQRIGRVLLNEMSLNRRYLYYFLQTRRVLDEVKATATGTMVKHTAPKRIMANIITYPENKQSQKEIVETLDNLHFSSQHLETIYKQKLTALTKLKQSILQKAFSGELTADTDDTKEDAVS